MPEIIILGSASLCCILAFLFKKNPIIWFLWGCFLPIISLALLVLIALCERCRERNGCKYLEKCKTAWFDLKNGSFLNKDNQHKRLRHIDFIKHIQNDKDKD